MDAPNRQALSIIRRCVARGRVILLSHFRDQLALRNWMWVDVLAVLDAPSDVRDGGEEEWGRPKWIVSGETADGLDIELVCVLDHDDHGNVTVFVTIY